MCHSFPLIQKWYYVRALILFTSSFQVNKFGMPTWRMLANAVQHHVGGNNPTLAQTIARGHPGE